MKQTLKALATRIPRWLRPFPEPAGTILIYHSITTEQHSKTEFLPYRGLFVEKDNFYAQIKHLSTHHSCLSLDEYLIALKNNTLPERAVCITFDDGYKDNLQYALPILESFNVPAQVYITPGIIEQSARLWWFELGNYIRQADSLNFNYAGEHYSFTLNSIEAKERCLTTLDTLCKPLLHAERENLLAAVGVSQKSYAELGIEVLSWDEVRTLANHPLISIGAHTMTHPSLSTLDENSLRKELEDSKTIIEKNIGAEVLHCAYPFGQAEHCAEREFEATKSLAYASGVTTIACHVNPNHGTRLYALPRIHIDYFETVADFAWKLAGWEAWRSR